MNTLLELKNISKEFPGVRALNNVSLDVRRGEVLALLGENGAGKSTLIKILTGVYDCTEGEIYWEGKRVKMNIPLDAQQLGIATIYQELTLCTNLTVAENVFLGREKTNKGFVDMRTMEKETAKVLEMLGVNIDPKAEVANLTVANQQLVEISRALMMDAKLLIMDEPTSSLSEHEVKALFKVLKQLVANGISILFISHKFDEIFEMSDRITILRDGEYICTMDTSSATQDEIIALMVGRNVSTLYPKHESKTDEVVFAVRNMSLPGKFYDVSFELHRGEILGFSGLVGAGRTEVFNSVFGLVPAQSGEMYINGEWQPLPTSVIEAMGKGIGLLPEDRKSQGLNLQMSISDNISMSWLCTGDAKSVLNLRQEKERAHEYIKKINIKTPSEAQLAVNLSGGNQQKVVIAKWLATNSNVLVFDEPTRGIDIGAKAEIYQLIADLAGQGYSIIMISSELPEIVGLSDRVIVMHEGVVKAELTNDDITPENIMCYATNAI